MADRPDTHGAPLPLVVEFTMLNQGKVMLCAISTTAMDDLDGRRAQRRRGNDQRDFAGTVFTT